MLNGNILSWKHSGLLSSKGEHLADVDKVLVHLVPKEYTVEPSTLQSLQQFLQWCADLALKLLATLPDLRHSRAPLVGYSYKLLCITHYVNSTQPILILCSGKYAEIRKQLVPFVS